MKNVSDVRYLNRGLIFSSLIGFCLSYYALLIETRKEQDPSYVAMCDISEHMSCSKAFMSKYGKGFGIIHLIVGEDSVLNQPNCLVGMIFYCLIAALSYVNSIHWTKILVYLCVLSNIGSIYLAYILYFILYDFCIVCVSTYIVNLVNLVLSVAKLRRLAGAESIPGKKLK